MDVNATSKTDEEKLEPYLQQTPFIPDEVTDYYLTKAGFDTADPKTKRLIGFATQKFIFEIIHDASQFSKYKEQGAKNLNKPIPTKEKGKKVLTLQDLEQSLQHNNQKIKKPDYYSDKPLN